MSRRTIGVDVDGVLADFVEEALLWANGARGTAPPCRRDQIAEFDILKCFDMAHLWAEFDRHVSRPGVCANLNPVEGAKEFLDELQRRADVVIVTSPWKTSPYWMWERRKWIEERLGFRGEIVFTKRKDLIRVDALVDDCAEHADAFPGPAILIDQPWNQHSKTGIRALSLPHAITRLEQIGLV